MSLSNQFIVLSIYLIVGCFFFFLSFVSLILRGIALNDEEAKDNDIITC